MYRKILVPLDGSARAEQALPHARTVAERFGASIVLARTVLPVTQIAPDPTLATGQTAPLIAHLVFGSVAEQILHRAHIPLLLIRVS